MRHRHAVSLILLLCALAAAAGAQEQVDKLAPSDARAGADVLNRLTVRVRVAGATPAQPAYRIDWRRGGEGLGGDVTRGSFAGAGGRADVAHGEWSAPLALTEVTGKAAKGWVFPTVVVAAPTAAGKKKSAATPLRDVTVEFEFAEDGKPAAAFAEVGVTGPTVGLAVHAGAADRASFLKALRGLSAHARARREHVEAFVAALPGDAAATPKRFGVIGHLGGYGEGSGYGIRHCNPAIVADECRVLRALGVNGFVGAKSVALADAAGAGEAFRHVYWGGPGSGSPMGAVQKRGEPEDAACPFDPRLPEAMAKSVAAAIDEHRGVRAQQSWALWWDEIGVAAKNHLAECPRCAGEFRTYLKAQRVEPAALGKASWDEVSPYAIWPEPAEAAPGARRAPKPEAVPAPADAAEALRYYYTHRFMTYATAKLFPASARALKEAGIPLYAMQGPTPSWSGHSLDWHEFYDLGANTAFVWETSNRDPRVWQFESYLADIGAGIARRHDMPMGVLIKPHRGAPLQRMLSAVARGVRTFEWYTYGPDYAKGDSFSQSPQLLEDVARAGRFLAQNEDLLYAAKPAVPAQVAFCSPRSSEIWGKATDLGVTAFEDAKWVYLALRHANIPVDILSEQQLAEPDALKQYKALYVVGPNLRNDATAAVLKWVEAGGMLWTDAMGMSRDEANQPNAAMDRALGGAKRELETWGTVPAYKATALEPLVERDVPEEVKTFSFEPEKAFPQPLTVAVGRERIGGLADADVTTRFGDGAPALWSKPLGRGRVAGAAYWAGLTYSASVRNPQFSMLAFSTLVRMTIYGPARTAGAYGPVTCARAEAVLLENGGCRVVALINWNYSRAGDGSTSLIRSEGVRVLLHDAAGVTRARSSIHGPLPVVEEAGWKTVTLPRLDEVDLLVLE